MALHILLVEDDEEDEFIFRDAIATTNRPVRIHAEKNGLDALAFLMALPANELPELVVSDLNMPKMNGSELLTRMKNTEKLRDIPVVIYSTSVNELEKVHCLTIGARAYISKPLTFKESVAFAETITDLCISREVALTENRLEE